MIPTVRDRMNTDFVQLSLNDSLVKARAALKGRDDLHGVILGDGHPITIVTLNDLEGGRIESRAQLLSDLKSKLPPGILTVPDRKLEDFVNNYAFVALDEGANGSIVVDQDKVIGILTKRAIDNYLAHEYESPVRVMGNYGLSGSITTDLVVILCDEFGHRNEWTYYPRNFPDCQVEQPFKHPLWHKV